MILTFYYIYATVMQWWRLGKLREKLMGTLTSENALLVCDESVIFDSRRSRSIENLLFRNENRLGVTIVPKKRINLGSQWLYFPRDYRFFPIHFIQNRLPLYSPHIYVLLKTVLETYRKHQAEQLQIENFGELLAWKATEHFEVIVKTDFDKLTKLVNCFKDRDCDINHEMQLLHIETIEIDGIAKRIPYERQYSTESTQRYSLAPVHWQNFFIDIKNLYAKCRDATNPKITIDNGTPKPEDVKNALLIDSKHSKKDKKVPEEKNTLDVNCSDYRRHRSTDHSREHRSREHKRLRSKEETDGSKHQKIEKSELGEGVELEADILKKDEYEKPTENKANKPNEEVDDKIREKKHKHKDKYRHKRSEDGEKEKSQNKEAQQSSSSHGKHQQVKSEKLKKGNRTSSKEKKLVRATATCDEPENEKTKDDNKPVENTEDKNGPNNEQHSDEIVSPSDDILERKTLKNVKPPNILVYADSTVARQNVKEVLGSILNREKYTIYDLPTSGPTTWRDSTALVVVCGSVEPELTSNLMKYLLSGGQLLCLCSDLLYSVLYTFTTAEVREHELVRFTYNKWKNVKMMHHIFCYQASPAKKQFSKDSDASNHSSGNGSSPIAPTTPPTVNVNHGGKDYTFQVQVLGAEETWQTPSLLLATVKGSGGKAVFSQVHLEIDPRQYVEDESKYEALKESNQVRLDILKDLLANQLDLDCNTTDMPPYTPAYFLGRHDLKINMLNETHCIKDNEMKAADLHVVFCGKDERYDDSTATFLPVLIHSCPQNFNTLSYFETLATDFIGRLVIYSDVLTSTHDLLKHNQLTHGVAVICRQQRAGVGRSKNTWISPAGAAMFSLQLHISNITNLGRCQGIIQHLIMLAVAKAIRRLSGNCKDIKIGIKWPNDLYVDGTVKIGGAIVTATCMGDLTVLNIGCGINLSNSIPTTCVNDVIKAWNAINCGKIPEISHEKYFAQVFNETEKLINKYQMGDSDYFFDYYYEYWLHNDASVIITTQDGKYHKAKVVGIDDHGFLRVRTSKGDIESVQPDGNSFDMMKGLIYPKNL